MKKKSKSKLVDADETPSSRVRVATGPHRELRLVERADGRIIARETVKVPEDFQPAMARLLSKSKEAADPVIEDVYNLESYAQNQFVSPAWRKDTQEEMHSFLMEELSGTLSGPDYEAFRQHGLAVPNESSRRNICNAVDEFILYGVFLCGPRLLLLPEVLQRMSDWLQTDEQGIRRYREFGENLIRLARVYRGEAKGPLSPWWVKSRSLIIKEVRTLKTVLKGRRRAKSWSGDLSGVWDAIGENKTKFPKIWRIGFGFLAFVASHTDALESLLVNETSPADFTGDLIHWVTIYEPESARQIISSHLSKLHHGSDL